MSAESTLIGTIRMMAIGSDQLSYCAASTRKTNSTESAKMYTAVLPVCRSWNASSVHSKPMLGERLCRIRVSMASSASPEDTPGAASPCSATEVNML